jgi:hypothetical protein
MEVLEAGRLIKDGEIKYPQLAVLANLGPPYKVTSGLEAKSACYVVVQVPICHQ